MGARGPAPKPTALRVLEGNPGKRPLNRNEPRPRPLTPKCPSWLDEDAKSSWRELMPMLERAGIVTEVDGGALSALCTAHSNWKAAEIASRAPDANWRATVKAREALKLYSALAREFGLTPSSRSRININRPEEVDPLADLLD